MITDPSSLEFDIERTGDTEVIVHMKGDLDLSTVSQARQIAGDLAVEGRIKQIYDLSAIDNVDSSGIGFFLGTWSELNGRGGGLAIAGAGDYITGIFNLVHLGDRVPLFSDTNKALAGFSQSESGE